MISFLPFTSGTRAKREAETKCPVKRSDAMLDFHQYVSSVNT